MNVIISEASFTDAPDIRAIYAPYVENTAYSFECVVPSVLEFVKRIAETKRDFPYLTAKADGKLMGYAYAHKPFSRQAYSWVAEISVYVDPQFHRSGVGRALYECMFDFLYEMGFFVIYATIESENETSIAFHRKMGFIKGPIFKNTGYKLGEWRSLVWMEKRIRTRAEEVKPIKRFSSLNKSYVQEIFTQKEKLIHQS